tara:strand:- start:214212 stop:215000 length:789 start_codon:yes stop_codon:yes gene_type:complete
MQHEFNVREITLFKTLSFLAFICVSMTCWAQTDTHESSKKSVSIITASSVAPYIIRENNKGIVSDLITEIFAQAGYTVNLSYASNKRLQKQMLDHSVDGAFNFPEGDARNLYSTEPIVTYQNIAITNTNSNITIDKIEDLRGRNIAAFQNASKYLDPEYADAVKNNEHYFEINEQIHQLYMLDKKRVDVIVMDKKIYQYYYQKVYAGKKNKPQHTLHNIFKPTNMVAVFHDEKLRDIINSGLEEFHKNGHFDEIEARYIHKN